MNKLTKEKRSHLILVAMVTLLIIAGLWFLLIRPQQSRLREASLAITDTQDKLYKMQKAADDSGKLEAELKAATEKLGAIEEGMASGDLYSWIIETVKKFKLGHNVDIPQFSPVVTGDVNLLPQFPYKQALLGVGGTACYQDFGKILAEFENHFPCMRVQNVELEPIPSLSSAEREKLSFRMEIVTLVKPASQ